METKGFFFQFEIVINVLLSSSAPFECLSYGVHGLYIICNSFSARTVLRRQNMTVFRRQILTSKDGPSAERVNVGSLPARIYTNLVFLAPMDVYIFFAPRKKWFVIFSFFAPRVLNSHNLVSLIALMLHYLYKCW